jgi:hypothetical protein
MSASDSPRDAGQIVTPAGDAAICHDRVASVLLFFAIF